MELLDMDDTPNKKRKMLDQGELNAQKSLGNEMQQGNHQVLERTFSCKETVAPGCPNNDPSGFRTVKKFKRDPNSGINFD